MLEEESLVRFMALKLIIRNNADNVPCSKKLILRLIVSVGILSKKTTPPDGFCIVGASAPGSRRRLEHLDPIHCL